jgi:archaemetzincin
VMKIVLKSLLICMAASCHQNQASIKIPAVKKTHHIAFLLYDDFDTVLLHTAVNEATVFYNCSATVLPSQSLPAFAFYTSRQRYKADSLLKFQTSLLPPGCETVIGLTKKDISTSLPGKPDWGIFGLGYQPGNACVISVYRLESTSYKQYQERFIKVLLHELGHNRGLPHCSYDEQCLMNDAGGRLAQVDKERKWLCGHCRKLLAG